MAGWYAIAKSAQLLGDYFLEGAEKGNVLSRQLTELRERQMQLNASIANLRQSEHAQAPAALAMAQKELQVVEDKIAANQRLTQAAFPGPLPPPPTTTGDDDKEKEKVNTADNGILTMEEQLNKRLAAVRQKRFDEELAADMRAGELGLAELSRRIAIRRQHETDSLQRAVDQSARITQIEREQNDTRISFIDDEREREIAEAEAKYNRRVEMISREIDNEKERNRLLQEEQILHREELLRINAEYNQADREQNEQSQSLAHDGWKALTSDAGAYYGEKAKYSKGDAEYEKENADFKERVLADGVKAIGKHSRAGFNIIKAAKIAQAVVDTYSGINRALGEYPPPTSFVLAAAVAAAGFANVASIASAKFGGGGGGRRGATGSSGGGSSPRTSAAQAPAIEQVEPNRQVTVNITPGIYSPADIASLIEGLNTAFGDNYDLKTTLAA